MVATRMEKVENLEKEFLAFKESMEQNMRAILSFMESQTENQDGRRQPNTRADDASREQSSDEGDRGDSRRHGWSDQGGFPMDSRLRRLDLPIFEGQDPVGWIIKMERFLVLGNFPPDEWLSVAVMALEGRALSWFTWAETRRPFRAWQALKQGVLERFQDHQDSLGCEVLLALKQEGTVEEFRGKFEAMATMYRGISEEVMIGAFMNGLREEIAVEIRMFKPQGLGNIMALAQSVERRNEALKNMVYSSKGERSGNGGSSNLRFNSTRSPVAVEGLASKVTQEKLPGNYQTKGQESGNAVGKTVTEFPRNVNSGAATKGGMVRRLSEEEYRRCREQGLCFKCFEKYSPTHVCKQKQLNVLIVSEEGEEEKGTTEDQEQLVLSEELSTLELSMKSTLAFLTNTPP